ncbi:DUF2637 domain-containing protein [Streptomyces sp. NPDC017940]|uniref:DUF2637 domain-containing protein n=1 Tax=Streptomyces sp. NPDC017940 TaxID=3365017 RepID=UPI0037A3EA22
MNPSPSTWDDPVAVVMHATLPCLFVIVAEAARHTVDHLAHLSTGRAMERVRPVRWLLDPARTFALWRHMVLGERTSYQQAVEAEQDRLVYVTRLKARHGRVRRAPAEERLPLKLARYGVPLPRASAARPQPPVGAAMVAGVVEHAGTPSGATRVPPAEKRPVPALSKTTGHAPVFAASTAPKPVTVRLPEPPGPGPDRPLPSRDGQIERTRQDAATGHAEKPQVTSASPGVPDALAKRNERAAEQARARRREHAAAWHTMRREDPEITRAAAARRLDISERTLRRALTENPKETTER